ncbi:MAG: YfcE family phosphodiesterase [Defluviitaleaceae bacterium]|nr:YfcE family phosphodiesterase [Defluviitaleaceae bacterium]
MKLLVFSDSHGDNKIMGDIIANMYNEIETILFLGDCVDDFSDFQYIYPEKYFIYVIGNCDLNHNEPVGQLIDIDGKKIFMTHGDRFGVKAGHKMIIREAMKLGADICLYGHSHSPSILLDIDSGVYLMNPGSISEPRRTDYPTFGIIDIEAGKISLEIIEVSKKGLSPLMSID